MNQAALYRSLNAQTRRDAKRILDKFAHMMQWRKDGRDSLIDIDSGPGDILIDYVYPLMPPKFEKVVCTDLSEKMVNYAQKCYSSYQRTEFHVLDICCEVLPKHLRDSFDHVISFYCLHWVQQQRKALENINQLLRSNGGDCLLVFLVRTSFLDIYKPLSENPKWSPYMQDYEQFISPYEQSSDPSAKFSQLLGETGFIDHYVEAKSEEYVYEGLKTVRDFIRSICPFIERVPAEEQEQFLDDCVLMLESMNLRRNAEHGNDFNFVIKYKLLIAYARKPSGQVKNTFM